MENKHTNERYNATKHGIDEPQAVSCEEGKRLAADFISMGLRTARKPNGGFVIIHGGFACSLEEGSSESC